jgi:4-amino-4-deoxy-L-arabinose transferase-like glycosyltransferase
MPDPQPQSEQRGGRRERAPALAHLLLTLVAGVLLYIPGLGRRGFAATEGHRVIPGWEMLETGNFWLPQMFGQVYLRKPPGMPWAVALSSAIFGQTEFAARLVSAASTITLALVTAIFAARWFGRRYTLAGGFAALLTPLWWGPARAAEIEALNNLGAALSIFLILDLLLHQQSPERQRRVGAALTTRTLTVFSSASLLAISLSLAALAKGPAAAPAIAAAILVPCLLTRSAKPLRAPALWLAALAAGAALLFIYRRIALEVESSAQAPVLQGVSDFLWTGRPFTISSMLQVLAMPAVALLSIAPWTLAMFFPWGADAAAEASDDESARAHRLARAATLTAILSILFLAAIGVRNERYAQPCLAFVPVLGAYMLRGFREQFRPHRRKIAGALMLGSPWTWPALLAVVAIAVIHFQRGQPGYSGRDAGVALARHLRGPADLLADHAIEARPEVLLYAQREAARLGQAVRPRWIPGLAARPQVAGAGAYLLLRSDEESNERAALAVSPPVLRLEEISRAETHKFRFTLLRVLPQTDAPDPGGSSP